MLRDATPADIPRLVQLGEVMHAESPVFRGLRFSAERLAVSIGRVIELGGFAKVVEIDGEIVGGMLALAVQHYASADLVASDLALFVAPQHRGGLAGPRLLNAFAHWARDVGAVLTMLGITTGVEPEKTEALCLRLGWERVGSIMRT